MTTEYLEPDLAVEEGRKNFPYLDSRNIWTIGIGHNLQVDPTLFAQLAHLRQVGITDEMVDTLFQHDLAGAKLSLSLHLPWWTQLDDFRQDVICDLNFNMGMATLLTFHHTLEAFQTGDFEAAADGLTNSLWHKQTGHRADRLIAQTRSGVHVPY